MIFHFLILAAYKTCSLSLAAEHLTSSPFVVHPFDVKTKTLTISDPSEFTDAYKSFTEHVIIGNGIIDIPSRAFYKWDTLVSAEISSTVTSIGDYAYCSCNNLKTVTFGEGLKTIGDYAFYSCFSLQSITIPSSVSSFGGYAFSSCYDLETLTIGKNVKTIGDCAFYLCSGLATVTIEEGV